MSLVGFALAGFVIVTAVATALLRDTLAAIIVFAAYSLGMALFYSLLLAPDVGLTEAAIGAGVTTILLLLTIAKTSRPADGVVLAEVNWPAAAVSVGLAAVMLYVVGAIPAENFLGGTTPVTGAAGTPGESVSAYYLAEAYTDTGVHNTVTAVLAAYRGFDTFGEAVVVFSAGVALLVVLRKEVFA
jgi:multicomponent Na+:H+ antiporter subunit B